MQQFWGASTIWAIANLFVHKTWSKEALLKDWWFPKATRNTFPAIMNIVASTILHTQLKPIQSVMLATVITCPSIYDSERGSHITGPKSKGSELHWIERKVKSQRRQIESIVKETTTSSYPFQLVVIQSIFWGLQSYIIIKFWQFRVFQQATLPPSHNFIEQDICEKYVGDKLDRTQCCKKWLQEEGTQCIRD